MFQAKEKLQEKKNGRSKKLDDQIQEPHFMDNCLPGFIEKDARYTRVVQAKQYSPEEIIELARKYGLNLNQEKHGHFINLLSGLNTSGFRWLLRYKPEQQVRALLGLAQKYGSIITDTAWEGREEGLLYYLNKNERLDGADQYFADNSLTMDELQDKMNNDQKRLMMDNLRILFPICGAEGTKKALQGAMLYVNTSYFDSMMGNQPRYFVQCLGRIARFIQSVYDGLDERYKNNYWLESTGSDRHVNGRHVVFLVNKKNKNDKKVLKPRALDIDDAVTGEEGMFHVINEEIGEEEIDNDAVGGEVPLLPTMHMETYRDRNGNPRYGIQDYQEKKTSEYSVDEAKKYYFQMGMLEIASRYLGMTDLHRDNIMPTKSGPLIIDAEVGLFFSATGLRDALTQELNQLLQPALAKIVIAGGHSYKVKGDNVFHREFLAGAEYMQRKMRELCQRPEFVNQLFHKTKNLCVRIVPVATNHLAAWYWDCVAMGFAKKAFEGYLTREPAGELGGKIRINYICNSLRDAISQKEDDDKTPYYMPEGTECRFNEEVIIAQTYDSMKKHDVPLFELALREGRNVTFLLNKKVIGAVGVEFRHEAVRRGGGAV